jgi:hypothetical protein
LNIFVYLKFYILKKKIPVRGVVAIGLWLCPKAHATQMWTALYGYADGPAWGYRQEQEQDEQEEGDEKNI